MEHFYSDVFAEFCGLLRDSLCDKMFFILDFRDDAVSSGTAFSEPEVFRKADIGMDGYVKGKHLHTLVFYDFRGYHIGDECFTSVIYEMIESLKKSEYAGCKYSVQKTDSVMQALHLSVCYVIFLIERKPVCYFIIISFRTAVSWVEICCGLVCNCESTDASADSQGEFIAQVQLPFQNVSSFVHADDAGFPFAGLVLDFRISVKNHLLAVVVEDRVIREQGEDGSSEGSDFIVRNLFVKQYGGDFVFHFLPFCKFSKNISKMTVGRTGD